MKPSIQQSAPGFVRKANRRGVQWRRFLQRILSKEILIVAQRMAPDDPCALARIVSCPGTLIVVPERARAPIAGFARTNGIHCMIREVKTAKGAKVNELKNLTP